MSGVNPYICQDIWFEVLKELPVKTLGICRCVCKSWYSLVVSPSFMAAHLKHYTQNDANSLLLKKEISECSSIGSKKYEQCALFRDSSQLKQGNRLHTSVFPFVVAHSWSSESFFYFVGSVNGLVCLSDCSILNRPRHRILILNPLLDKFVKLPLSPSMADFSWVGFGYDFRKNDHRVIKISCWCTNTPSVVEIYSVQERTWRTICSKYLVDNSIKRVSASHCFLNGIIHWHSRNKWLLLFNVTDETFAKMELPEEIMQNYGEHNFGVFEYQGKLSISGCHYADLGLKVLVECNVWMKGEYNVGNSWCKVLSINMLDKFYYCGPLEYLGENEELIGLSKSWHGELVCYDPKTKQITELGHCNTSSTIFSAYSPSLALLDLKIDHFTAHQLEW